MPGIFGLVSRTAPEGTFAVIGEMAARMRHHPWYEEGRYVDEAAGLVLGRMALDVGGGAAQPAFNEDRSIVVVMDGEVYDDDAQRRTLCAAGHVFQTDNPAELLAHGYESGGTQFFQGLHGKFVAAVWDARARRLTLVNDRFGMRPLYYARLPGRLLFASEIKALLADPHVSRQTNLRGVAQFFTYGQLLGEDTLLEEVRLLPGAGWLTYHPADERLTLERYWKMEDRPRGQTLSDAETLDRIADAFDQAVARCTRGADRLGLSLSGGLDSRTLLGAIDPAREVATVSIGVDGSMDHRSAEEMAKLTGRAHHRCLLDDRFLDQFADHLRQMVRLTDGHYLSQCIVMPTLPFYRDLGIRVLLRGHAGELMHMNKAYSFSLDREALAIRDEAGLQSWLFRHLQTYMLDGTEGRLFAPAYREQMTDLAQESLHVCLRASRGAFPPVQRVWQLFLSQRLRRETAMSLVKFGALVETRLPYVDNELVEALLDAPPRLKLGERIQTHILRRRCPAFLDVVNVNTGARMGAGPVGLLIGKVRQKVLAKLGVRGYQPYERLGLWLRRELRPLVGQVLLDPRCLERGLFDPQSVRDVVDKHTSGQRNHTFLLMAMMIFELGQREFIDESTARSRPRVAGAEPCLRS